MNKQEIKDMLTPIECAVEDGYRKCARAIIEFVGNAYRNGDPHTSVPDEGYSDTVRYTFDPSQYCRLSQFNGEGMVDLRPYGVDIYVGDEPYTDENCVYLWYGDSDCAVDMTLSDIRNIIEMTREIFVCD